MGKLFFDNCQRIEWEIIYTNNFKCILKSSLRAFQYQIILRKLPTNKFLFRCGLSTTDKCSFCEVNTETIEHQFWYCPLVKNFWFMLFEALGLPSEIKLELNGHNVLLCCCKGKTKNYAILYSLRYKIHIQNKMHGKYTLF